MRSIFQHNNALIRVLIFGHKEFSQLVSEVIPEFSEKAQFKIVDQILGSASEIQDTIRDYQPDVVLSGGANAVYLKSCLNIPVVSTQVTDADIIQAIERAAKVTKHVVLINFNTSSPIISLAEKALDIKIQEEIYSRTDQAREIFHIVSRQPDIAVVGASLVCGLASKNNVRSFLFYSAKSCRKSVQEAIEQGRQFRGVKSDHALLEWLRNQSKTPIIMTDKQGESLTLNQAARHDLNLSLDFEIDLQDLIHHQAPNQPSDGECSINGSDWWFHRDEVKGSSDVMYVYQLYRKKPRSESPVKLPGKVQQLSYQSPEIKEVIQQVSSFANSPSNVLIYGESGTGKELIARELHRNGSFSSGNFVALNCSAIPTELFESELFGHKDGAYTGARRGGRKGLIEEAQGGVLFLDEISELALDQQAKLLRFLQERMFRPLGANQEKAVHLKLVAASNKQLKEQVENGSFRQDLFFRLNVFNINIPALRFRKDDVICIANVKLKEFILSYQLPFTVQNILPRIQHALTDYTWPGNVRELENILERLVAYLFTRNTLDGMESALRHVAPELFVDHGLNVKESLVRSKELALVAEAMSQFSGDKQKVAQYLGLSQTTLWRRLKRLKNY